MTKSDQGGLCYWYIGEKYFIVSPSPCTNETTEQILLKFDMLNSNTMD